MPTAVRSLAGDAPFAGNRYAMLDQVGPIPQHFSYRHPAPLLQHEVRQGEWETLEIEQWREVKLGQDGADDTMTITVDAMPTAHESETFRRFHGKFSPDYRVRLVAPWGGENDRVIFQGYPLPFTLGWTPERNSISVLCLSEGQKRLRFTPGCQILGRYMRSNPASEWQSEAPKIQQVERFPVVFNAGGKPNRTAEAYRFGVYTGEPGGEGGESDDRPAIHLFTTDNAPGAAYWTYVQALRYLAYLYIQQTGIPVSVGEFLADTTWIAAMGPAPFTVEPFDRRISAYCPEVSVQSLNVEEAIATLCQRAGLHYHIPVVSKPTDNGASVKARFYLRVHATVGSAAENDDGVMKRRFMREGKTFDLPSDRPHRDQSGRDPAAIAESNKVVQADLTIDRRAINQVLARGGPITYEVTLLLRPGWAPHEYLDNLENASAEAQKAALDFWAAEFQPEYDDDRVPRSAYHGQHKDNYTVADVFRLWVFPDSTEYINAGLVRSLYDATWYSPFYDPGNPSMGLVYAHSTRGGGLFLDTVKNWVPVRRPFRNTIGRTDLATSDTSPIVRVNFEHTGGPETALAASGWIKYAGQPHICEDRAAIRFDEDNPFKGAPFLTRPDTSLCDEETAIARYIQGQFYVSITCTIEDDRRMQSRLYKRAPSTFSPACQVMDYGLDRFQQRHQWASSHLFGNVAETDPAFRERDDFAVLSGAAQRDLEHLAGETVSGNPEIFYLDQTYWPGDSFSGIDGLAIGFFNYPAVERIEFTNRGQGDYRTILHLSDLRHQPEVDSE